MDPFDLRKWPGFVLAGGTTSDPAVINQICLDSRRIDSPRSLFVALPGTIFDGHRFVSHAAKAGASYALVRKDWIPDQLPNTIILLRVDDPLKAFQQIAAVYRKSLPTRVVGITGSYGKTMVKDLLQAMLGTTKQTAASPESFNSQIGVPLSLLTMTKDDEIALIEAGISEKNEMDVLAELIAPDYAVLTHIGKKHIATLGNIQTIAAEQVKLLFPPKPTGWVLLPNDSLLDRYKNAFQAPSYYWNERAAALPHVCYLNPEQSSKMTYRIEYPCGQEYQGHITTGFYYIEDLINIASKAAWLLGIPAKAISEVLEHYKPEPMRTEIWKSPVGTTFINDSYCSDPQSIDVSLRYFEQGPLHGRKVFVFGGMKTKRTPTDTDYRCVAKTITRNQVGLLVLTGNHSFGSLIEEVKTHAPETEISLCPSYQDAINLLRVRARQDDVVLIKGEKKESLDILTEAFNDSICTNQCMINLAAVQSNIETIRQRLPKGTRIMATVKALAYGTDDVRMAKFLATCGVDILCVSYVEEGVALKRAGVMQSIFTINAAFYEAAKVVKWGLEVGVSDALLASALSAEAVKQGKSVKVHLHVDTGMSRFGCRVEEAVSLAVLIRNSPGLELVGIMTHFACADMPEADEFTLSQASHFDEVIATMSSHGISIPWKHAANSSAALRFHFPQYTMVRVGLAIYGLYSSDCVRKALELRSALSLVSRIVGINHCVAGETISYGRSYTVAREKERIAVLPIGYFDGLHRNYSGKGYVIVRGQKAPMVGKICMDFMMIDVTNIPTAEVGDSVLIFGEDEYGHYLSPEDLASKGGSIVHELVTCLGPRIQRVFVHEEARPVIS
jgi:alanine racemase/UDP-N-acetylmuramoyl-tripeptide--D-alanyl-D-alanine ligase